MQVGEQQTSPPSFAKSGATTKTNTKENQMKKLIKTLAIVLVAIVAFLMIGVAGNNDLDEYIEVNSKPVTKFIYNRR